MTINKSWDLEELQRWERLITYGRPGWAALWKVNSEKSHNPYSPKKLLRLAERKLTAGIQNSTWVLTNGEEMLVRTIKLTILSRRALIRIGFHSQEARCMVASCMGICTGISHDLKLIRVQSLSEPILSEAAARLIHRHNLWPDLLETLTHGLQHGLVNTGAAGEIVAWILLSITWDAACIRKFQTSDVVTHTRSDVTVNNFIEALLGYVPEIVVKESSEGISNHVLNEGPSNVSEQQFSMEESDGTNDFSNEESDVTSEQAFSREGTECTSASAKIDTQAFVKELLARRICFTHVTQLSSTRATFKHLQDAARRMQLSACAPLTHSIDAFTALFPASEAENQELWSLQIQARNHGQFDKKACKASLEKMSEAAIKMARTADSGKPSFLPGLDMYMHIGHKVRGRKYCDFHVRPKSQRACLVLSTDSCLTLFQPAIRAVCGQGNEVGAAKLTSLLSKLIDLERLTLSQMGPWSMDHMPESVKKPPACGQIPLNKQLEYLQEIMCAGEVYHIHEQPLNGTHISCKNAARATARKGIKKGVSKVPAARATARKGISKEPAARATARKGIKKGISQEPAARATARKGISKEPAARATAREGISKEPAARATARKGISKEPAARATARKGISKEPAARATARKGISKEPVARATARKGINKEAAARATARQQKARQEPGISNSNSRQDNSRTSSTAGQL